MIYFIAALTVKNTGSRFLEPYLDTLNVSYQTFSEAVSALERIYNVILNKDQIDSLDVSLDDGWFQFKEDDTFTRYEILSIQRLK